MIPVKTSSLSACLRQAPGESAPSIIREYALRIHRNQRILSCQGQNGLYWEVIDSDGTRYYYGVSVGARLQAPDQSLTASWLLEEVEDPNGNLTNFFYKQDSPALQGNAQSGINEGDQLGVQAYLERIDYTGHRSQSITPAYRAALDWNCDPTAREDKSISARLGFVTYTRCKLRSIAVLVKKTEDETQVPIDSSCYGEQDWETFEGIRCYKLEYKESNFDGKTLLAAVSVEGADGGDFYEHRFDYTDPENR